MRKLFYRICAVLSVVVGDSVSANYFWYISEIQIK